LALQIASPAAAAPSLAAAQAFVERTYAAYCDSCKGPDFESPRLLSPRLLALVRRDRWLTPEGDVGALDGDPICDCQDWKIRSVRVEVQTAGAERATAVARFVNAGHPAIVKLDLVVVKDAWRIDNIHSQTIPDLASLLRAHARGR
jgi:hypothetical protein